MCKLNVGRELVFRTRGWKRFSRYGSRAALYKEKRSVGKRLEKRKSTPSHTHTETQRDRHTSIRAHEREGFWDSVCCFAGARIYKTIVRLGAKLRKRKSARAMGKLVFQGSSAGPLEDIAVFGWEKWITDKGSRFFNYSSPRRHIFSIKIANRAHFIEGNSFIKNK